MPAARLPFALLALAACSSGPPRDPSSSWFVIELGSRGEMPTVELAYSAVRVASTGKIELFVDSRHEERTEGAAEDDGYIGTTSSLLLRGLDGEVTYDHTSQDPSYVLRYRRAKVFGSGAEGFVEDCETSSHLLGGPEVGLGTVEITTFEPEAGRIAGRMAFDLACTTDIGVVTPTGTVEFNAVDLVVEDVP